MSNSKEESKNTVAGPDYGQLMKHNTNGAIIEAFVSYLFSEKKEFSKDMVAMMVRNMVIILCVKMLVEESKTYLDKLKISNLNPVRHFWQWMRYSEVSYDLVLVSNKWLHEENIVLSTNLLSSYFEPKGIMISQPNTYYLTFGSYLLKVIVTSNKISIRGPKVDAVRKHIVDNIIVPTREHLLGGTTMMFRVLVNNSQIMRLESVKQTYAVETTNYRDLKKAIKSMFLIEDVLKFPAKPFCINFDGPPGTGKTTFGSYIASEGIFDRVIMYNMIQQCKNTFSENITFVERQITNGSPKDKKIDDAPESILLILDEIDKWLASHIELQINKCREDARVKKDIVKGEKEGASVVETHAKLSLEEEKDKAAAIKNEFLDQLFNLVEGHTLSDSRRYVLIFNTNNFDEMFANVPDRYLALLDRFQKYKFDKIGKKEIVSYIDDITERFVERIKDHERKGQKYDNPNLETLINYDKTLLDAIPDETRISYRHLLKILRTNRYEIPSLVETLKSLPYETDSSELYSINEYYQVLGTVSETITVMSTLGRVQVRSDLPPVTLGRTTVPPAPVTLGRTTAPVTLGRTTAPVTLGRTTAPVPLGRTTAPVTLGRISVPQSESMFSQRPETTLGLKPATTPVRVVEFPSLQKLGRVDVQQPEPMPVSKPDLPIPAPEIKRDTSPEKLQRIALPQNREPDVVTESTVSGNESSPSVTDLSNKPAGSYEGSMSSIFCEDNTSPANTEEKREAISLKLRERSEASETLADSVLIIEKSIQKWVTERKESFEEEACAAFIKKYEAVKEEWGSFVRDTVEIMKHIDTKFKAVRYCDVKMSIEEALVNILASYILIGKDAIAGDGIDNTLHVTKRKYFGTSTPRTDYYYLHQLHPTQDDVLKSDGLPEDLINAIMKDSYPSVSMRAEEFLRTLDSKLTNLHCLKYQLKDQDEKHNSFLKLKEDFTARVLALNKTIRIQEADIENTVDKDVKQALIENQKDRLEQKRKLSQEIKTLNEKIEEVIRIKDGGTLKDDTTTPRDIGLHKKIDAAINAIFSPIHFECVMHADWPTTLEFSIFCSLFPEDADYKKFKETISRLG